MKTLRLTCAATILSLTLAVSAFAGHMETTGATALTPSTSSNNVTTSLVLTVINLAYR